ncbi:receptor-type tyrosine-protein phosphatase delta isoform X34 [Canis lupus familiaris]|uniref:receptor-type tyrosine-protein phosphatase delta isoform X34 n=1 Tax=Canis lupus familiaris TaxID=9615 RepID=UPI000BAA0AF9|nr:receptor-type tyrosine-protein phosphatase delta isoform X34 [Canis lupus familiaris]XP_025857172.1 receptor-type tyrosine-protein phosphatase delta isoform X9 [Vulpes vulpes]XP_038408304.1 receptor-type tyrosine-protein phosphatase delta isoform X34 [Canis lupus familiaris]XP_038537659.1 receptor-type tyrosine-protein phosphatase delta isoform X34 [Canis lupus familiaris]XP_041619154.1 receptor-type tyrosine-protein phosphatase delta isoform X28 [Vulpes lagopus]|eukprot:XP_022281116.1 receptor-type tyrosine-protein phosphatase delta isoform X32 [Canis lupus familiaris]
MVPAGRPLLLLVALLLRAQAETPPRFTRTPVDQTGVSGGVASFICQATGDPRPKIVWNKKGKKVSNQRFEVIEFDDGSGSVLRIQPLRTPRDEAIYECVASNNVGEISVSTRLTVLREDQIPRGFPTIDMGPQLKVVERTRTATMLCAASGNPDPEITWFKDFLPVDTSNNNGRIKQLRSESIGGTPIRGALQIEQSEESDQGKYECVATNSAGTRYSAPANLYVRELREVRRVPPRFSIPPTNHEIMPGGSVNITCVAVGSPMPYVKWMLGAEDLTPEDDMPIGRNVLELNDVRQSANYTCVAMSTLGVIEAIAQITVKALPKPPGTPVVTESTATSITLTWDSGNPEPVSYYIIQHKPKNSEEPYKEIDGVATTRYSVAGLSPYSDYEFRVVAVNNIGRGPPSEPVLTQTSEQAPSSAPRDVQARMLSSTTILVQWKEPEEPNGQIQGYRVYYTMDPTQHVNNWMKHNVADSQITTIGNLVPQKTYSVKVLAFTSIGDGPLSSDIQVITQTGVPGQPLNFKAEPESETSILLSWTPPRSDTIASYELVYKDGEHGEEQRVTIEPGTSYRLQGLKPNSLYYFRLAARSPQGLGASTAEISARTMQSMFAKNFHVKAVMKTSVLLSWEIPENYNSAMPFKILYDDGKMVEEVDGRATQKLIVNLKPEKSYSFVLTNRGNSAGGLQHRVTAKTAPDVLRTKPAFIGKTNLDGMITVQLPEVPANENIKGYYIIIVPLKKSRGKFIKPWESPDEMELDELLKEISRKRRSIRYGREVELKPYIAAHFDVLPTEFTLGDDKHYGGFTNKQLQSGQEYVFFVLAVMEHAESKMYATSPYSDPVVSMDLDPQPITDEEEGLIWVVGPVLAVVFIICIVIAILLYKSKPDRKRAESDSRKSSIPNSKEVPSHHPTDPVELRRLNFQTPGMASHPPIPILELADHIERLKANDNLKFSQEYESIDPGQQFTWEHSNLEVNKPKNRYANVIAYDHSRVLLSAIEGIPGSDYVNANYIDGYRKQNAYIATQGSLPETFGDFWRMIWEQRSATVVMMTKLEERSRVKCDQYWPSRGTESHGLVQVTLLDTVELATYCVRTFALYKNGSSEKREVRQFQFTAWPDHGVPEHPTPFLAFLRRVKTCNPPDAGPMVVHCSAGVGRTGCFIVIDAMLERIKHEKTVDIYGHVTLMRAQRNYMVQTEDQYIFIHDALLEAVTCGNTEVPARNLYAYIQKLTQIEAGENVTGMELEFKRLASSKAHTSRFISANLPCNKFKNRLVNIMPYESTRVCLQPIRGVEGSDYINASFIDGYRQQKAYIATQGPLAETTEDFWRMLWEHNSTIVVMLTKLREMGREKCHQYWPAERSARYQYFVVDPMAEYNMPQYILREFKVTDARDGQSRTVRQFQFTDWPEQGVPKSGEGFIDFIGQVHKTKEQFGQDGPISVHCSAGVGRTGVFITLSIVLERMRYEGVVDIFQTVKMLRTQRPAMVQTEDQYQFCYRAALEYLGSFDHYAT